VLSAHGSAPVRVTVAHRQTCGCAWVRAKRAGIARRPPRRARAGTMESDLHGPTPVPVVVRDGARSCFARVRGSRSWSHKSQVGQYVNLTLDCLNLTCICYRVCVVPRLTLLLWASGCMSVWSVECAVDLGVWTTWSNKRRCNAAMALSP
jgi:hypothetical protein